jgi:hypothetical protein
MGRHNRAGPIPNSYPLKFLTPCGEKGGKILLYLGNEPSPAEMLDDVLSEASLHAF